MTPEPAGRPVPESSEAVPWHLLEPTLLAVWLETDLQQGLEADEVERRRTVHGPNTLNEPGPPHPIRLLLAQFSNLMVLLLIAAAGVSAWIGDAIDSLAIAVIVVLNAGLGFLQEYRAQRALESLKVLHSPTADVIRAGRMSRCPVETLVPGDLVRLEAGAIVPADLRLVEVHRLKVDESILTGESLSVEKQAAPLGVLRLPLSARANLAFQGTRIAAGRGLGVVVATGERTEFGRIRQLMDASPTPRTPLERRLTRLGLWLSGVIGAVSLMLFSLGVFQGEPLGLMAMTAISLAVAAIPEALPAVATVALALGAAHMARRRALIRRLHAVETLGSVSVICTDKTGTLTENRMVVVETRLAEFRQGAAALPATPTLAEVLLLNNDVILEPQGTRLGDPTEVALLDWALAQGVDRPSVLTRYPRLSEWPFDSDRKRMTTLHHQPGGGTLMLVKGAPDVVLARTRHPPEAMLQAAAHDLASRGMRVIAVALKGLDGTEVLDGESDQGLIALGLVALQDPPRSEVREAVRACRSAGIRILMMTGDHPETARAIAMQVGLVKAQAEVMTGEVIDRLDDPSLARALRTCRLLARMAPAQKNRVVELLKQQGDCVAMTGDGVNDAPALKRADIGVAMGLRGTAVAKEAALLILLDDHFATIVRAVEEGRRIDDNVRKFIRYALTCNTAEVLSLLLAPLLGLPLPLLPLQILWINLVTDGLPGLALALEPLEANAMQRPPRPMKEGLFGGGLGLKIGVHGVLMALLVLGLEAFGTGQGLPDWQTQVFTVLSLSQMSYVLAIRTGSARFLGRAFWTNPGLLAAVGLTLGLQLMVLYVPWFQRLLHTQPLSLEALGGCWALASVMAVAVEIERFWGHRPRFSRGDKPR